MKSSLPISLLFLMLSTWPSLSEAESSALVTFVNGEIADAEDVNSNFDNHEQRIKAIEQYGGCSATQDGSNVVISCADGTSGVLAGAGTVVVYPQGMIGEIPTIEYETGDIVLVDNDDTVLGKASRTFSSHQMFDVPVYQNVSSNPKFYISNNALEQKVEIGASTSFNGRGNQYVYYLESDCSGSEFVRSNRADVAEIGSVLFVPPQDPIFNRILFQSRILSAFFDDNTGVKTPSGDCESDSFTENATPAVTFTPASEILNAAYPVRLEQLP